MRFGDSLGALLRDLRHSPSGFFVDVIRGGSVGTGLAGALPLPPRDRSSRTAPTAPSTPDASAGRKIVEPLPSASFGSASRYLSPSRYIAACPSGRDAVMRRIDSASASAIARRASANP